jgi:hypothetical protein
MKSSELVRFLEEYDPSSDVLIAGVPGGYLDFKMEMRDGASLEQGGLPILAIKATRQIQMLHIIVEE